MGDDLKPCPWCGKAPKVVYPDVDGGCTLRHQGSRCLLSGELWLFGTPEQAVETWNERKVDV